ncbi:MAG: CaiB/BaiF CoA transferase family protein [Steroidobacteraceae bacterium]
MRPLEGIRIVDFSTLLPGPLASLMLAEAGAQVVKIERPGRGDEMRSYEPKWGRDSVNFSLLNRGKTSLALDLKTEADRASLQPLLEQADVIIEQFRPDVMARLNLDYDSIVKLNPRVIYCSITGYGQTGPKRNVAGHDLNYIGDAGLLHLSSGSSQHPVVPPALIADIAGGSYPAVINILLALRERDITGRGRRLDIAMTDNLFTFMYWALGSGFAAGHWPGNGADLVTGGSPRYRLYATRDGRLIAAAPIEQRFWDAFCELIALEPELRDDSKDPAKTTHRVAELIASRSADEWRSIFVQAECCCSVVAGLQEALTDPHFVARGLLDHTLVNEFGQKIPALPIPIDAAFRDAPGSMLSAPVLQPKAANAF